MTKLLFLSWTLLFSPRDGLMAHPISDSTEMRYTESGTVLVEDGGVISPLEFSLPDQTSQSGTGQGFSSLLTEGLNKDVLRSVGFVPAGSVEEGLLEKPGSLHPFRRFLGPRKPHEKRGNPAECFWKYCV